MSKRMLLILLLVTALVLQSTMIHGGSLYYENPNIEVGKVVEIIDGEVIKVFFFRRRFDVPSVETVKMIGIDTDASVEAFDYTSNRLLGKSVYLTIDDNPAYKPDNMVHANVFHDFDKTVSEELLELGYARVDDTYKGSEHYHSFLSAQYSAKLYEQGLWATNLSETTDRINLNTATSLQIQDHFDIEQPLAYAIYNYRLQNPYNDITEIMAVDSSFNAQWFEDHRHLMSVVTNVNKASYAELSSLIGNASSAQEIIDDIDYYIRFNEVKTLEELKSINTFSPYYDLVEEYLTLEATNVFPDNNKYIVNINTCNSDNFVFATGLNSAIFKKLESIREDDYVISSVGELYRYNSVIDYQERHIYSDRLHAYTDINTAKHFELMTLFDQMDITEAEKNALADDIIEQRPYLLMSQVASALGSTLYNEIKPYIYVYEEDIADRYNSHTVPEELIDDMDRKYRGRSTQFTNINLASQGALLDLHPDMTDDLVDAIVAYREKHHFRYLDDLQEIFREESKLVLFNKLDNYIVFE